MTPYPKYKHSGIEWIGEIPEHWEVKRTKWIFSESKSRNKELIFEDKDLLSVSEYYGVDKRINKIDNNEILNRAESLAENKVVNPNDLVINIMLAWKKGLGVSKNTGIVSPSYCVFTLKSFLFNSWFYHYLFRTDLYAEMFRQNSTGIIESRLRLYPEEFFNILSLIPPLPEQTAIADFLDKKTALIDSFIEKKKKLIELLKEERTAIINQAVTKGINPNAKMKPSGIDWLGDIPQHWEVKKLKYSCQLLKDGTHLPPLRVEKGFPLLSVRNLVDGKYIQFLDDDSMISEEDFNILERVFKIQENDVLLAIVGATMGKVSIVPKMEPFTIQRSVAIFRVKSNILKPLFLFYFLQSKCFQTLIWNNTGFSAQPGIYLGSLMNFSVTCPNLKEQEELIDFIQIETHKIDLVISTIEKEIELMQEYRTALINEVVTGKWRVKKFNKSNEINLTF